MRLLGVDLTATEVRLARAERRFGVTRLVACTRAAATTADARRTALAPVLAWRPHVIVAALPVAQLGHRIVTLPFRDARRLGETVLLELVGQLPADPGDVASGHLPLGADGGGTRVLAALARRGHVDALCDAARAAGMPAVSVDAALIGVAHLVDGTDDTSLLLADGERSAIAIRRGGRLAGLRALASDPTLDAAAFVREVRWTLAALGGADRLVVLGADVSASLSSTLAGATGARIAALAEVVPAPWRAADLGACAVAAGLVAGPGITLHHAVERAGSGRHAAMLAAAVALFALGDLGIVHWRLARRDAALAEAVRATATAALPAGTRVVAPRAQLEAAAAAAGRRSGTAGDVLALLRELSTRVPSDVRVGFDELTVEGDVLRLRGRIDRFESIDAVTRALAASTSLHDVVAEESRAAVDGNGVQFAVRATWRPALGAPS